MDRLEQFKLSLQSMALHPEQNSLALGQVLRQLQTFPVTLELLQKSGIGKQLNTIRKSLTGENAKRADEVIGSWKRLVRQTVSNRAGAKKPENGNGNSEKEKPKAGDEANGKDKAESKEQPKEQELIEQLVKCDATHPAPDFGPLLRSFTPAASEPSTLAEYCVELMARNVSQLSHVPMLPRGQICTILRRCQLSDLRRIHNLNPYFHEQLEPLWQIQCFKVFKVIAKPDHVSWHDVFEYMQQQQEKRAEEQSKRIAEAMKKMAEEKQQAAIKRLDPREAQKIASLGKRKKPSTPTESAPEKKSLMEKAKKEYLKRVKHTNMGDIKTQRKMEMKAKYKLSGS